MIEKNEFITRIVVEITKKQWRKEQVREKDVEEASDWTICIGGSRAPRWARGLKPSYIHNKKAKNDNTFLT